LSKLPVIPRRFSLRILRHVSQSIIKPLTLLFNQSLQCGRNPYIWKRSHVTPVYKNKGCTSEVSTFRPISLTCVLCKIMEKIIIQLSKLPVIPRRFSLYIRPLCQTLSKALDMSQNTNRTSLPTSNYIEASEILSTNLGRIYNWSRDWAIKFNPNKTESLLFTRKNNVDFPNVYFGNPDNIVTNVEMQVLYYKQVLMLYHLCTRGIKTDPIQAPGGPQHLLPPNQTRNPHALLFAFYLLNSQLSN
jgi:hypothetical protein